MIFKLESDFENTPDFIPLMSSEEEDELSKSSIPEILPILPLRNTVLFPGVVIPITVGRDKSIKLIKDAYKGDRTIGVVAQKDGEIEDPSYNDLYRIGTVASIMKMLRMPDGNTTVIIQGKRRFELQEEIAHLPYITARIRPVLEEAADDTKSFAALIDSVKDTALKIVEVNPNLPAEAGFALKNIHSNRFLINFISSNLNLDVKDKQAILESGKPTERATRVLEHLTKELHMLELKAEIQNKVRDDIDKQQRDYFLQQQLKQIHEELGDNPDRELLNLKERAAGKKWPAYVAEAFQKEIDKLQRMNSMQPDYSVGLNYVSLLLDLPWEEYTKDHLDLKRAAKILDEDHFGMEKVKKRILEYLAVLKLKGDMKSPILCLVGPPGVGKTSLGRSIARAVGRQYTRVSLGGLHDEAEIRGHRKTYIGAMPGRIIQSINKSKSSNPLFVLDEIDKLGRDFRGDPSSALLEVLDPEQNNSFYDNYLELGYDLSKVMFIATANSLDSIQPALLDRMEVIEITGYTQEEKVHIARKHLIPKQRQAHGLKAVHFDVTEKGLEFLIQGYTRESGVRGLDKQIAGLARSRASEIVGKHAYSKSFTPDAIEKALGAPRMEAEVYSNNESAGVVTGLAWTQTGGEILYIETALTKGNGKLSLTGSLGDVMKESAAAGLTYLKSHTTLLGLEPEVFKHWDIHIHVPAGAVPKDGPSAGVTMLTSLASAFTQRKVKNRLAMTGEITLRGAVLPVGGIKEKILAARRAGIQEIILSKANEKDIREIPAHYVEGMVFHFVQTNEEVLKLALTNDSVENPLKIQFHKAKEKIGF